jgi:hypothetical protein
MRPLLAIVLCLLLTLQAVAALARPVQLCCHGPCEHEAVCVLSQACHGCVGQAVLPTMPRVAAAAIANELPASPMRAVFTALPVDIWRPPPVKPVQIA